jgi:hypothetical protein
VIANGIASDPVPFTVPGGPAPAAGRSHVIAPAQGTVRTSTLIEGASGVPRPGHHRVADNADGVGASLAETGTGTGSAPAAAVTTAAGGAGVGAAVVPWDRLAVLGYTGPASGTPETAAATARVTDVSADAARDALFASGDLTLRESLRNA